MDSVLILLWSCKALNEKLENARDKFKKRRDLEITKLFCFRRLAQKKERGQRLIWRKTIETNPSAHRSVAVMPAQKGDELEEQTKSEEIFAGTRAAQG